MLEQVKERMSILNSGENNPMYGRKHSEETREGMRENYSDELVLALLGQRTGRQH
jgi:hypothetical protein